MTMTFIAIIFGFLPAFVWLVFYLKEDPHPEPKRLIALTFVVGSAFAFFALAAEIVLVSFLAKLGIASSAVLSIILLAFIEEIFKFEAAYFTVHKSPDFNEPIDAMIYIIVAALGFATVENLGVLTGVAKQTALLNEIFETASLRFLGATLLHTLSSGVLGYYWAKSIREFNAKKPLILGFFLATVLHIIFNLLIIKYGNLMYPFLFVVTAGFFCFKRL